MIRKFNIDDMDAVMLIWLKENINSHSFIPKEYWKKNYEYVKSVIPNAELYVYTDNDTILGFIGLSDNYIEGIFIKTDSQHKGIGTELLKKAKQKSSKLMLNVYKKNVQAINFYKKNGFEIIEENIDIETNETEYTMIWKND